MSACARETEIATVSGRGELTAELSAHVAACEECTRTLMVLKAFGAQAAEPTRSLSFPPPAAILLRARWAERRARERRAATIMWFMQGSLAALAALVVLAVAVPSVNSVIGTLLPLPLSFEVFRFPLSLDALVLIPSALAGLTFLLARLATRD